MHGSTQLSNIVKISQLTALVYTELAIVGNGDPPWSPNIQNLAEWKLYYSFS